MADTQQPVEEQVPHNAPASQQVTSKTPATKQKNPKRVAAGKATAERTRIARDAQKKALIEAQSFIAQAKQADPVADTPSADPVEDAPSAAPEPTKNVLTTTQWLSIISIVVSLAGLYYKREYVKNLLTKKADPPRSPPQSPVLSRAPPSRIRQMD